jgi:CRP/FNR family transcriptional regulator, cyclic AMP receptor protein
MRMIQTLERIIGEHPFFQGMAEQHLKFIAGCATNARFPEGQLIFREGDEANQFYFVRAGLIGVELVIPPRGFTTVQTVGEGEMLGWSWLLPPYRWHFTGRALEPTRALAFDGKCLRTRCEADHDLGYEVLKRFTYIVNERLDAMRLQLLDLYGVHA